MYASVGSQCCAEMTKGVLEFTMLRSDNDAPGEARLGKAPFKTVSRVSLVSDLPARRSFPEED